MLYDRWRAVAAESRREWALLDFAADRRWTFGELLAASDNAAPPEDRISFPQGNGSDFILELLRAWRHGCPACPLEADQARPEVPLPPASIVHLKRTSATTGPARFVAFTAEQLAADPTNIVATMGLRPEWPNLGAISLAHSYGFSNLVLPLLLHGIPLALAGSPLPEALRQAAAELNSPLSLAGVPALWRAWHEADAIPPRTRLAISAGAALPLPLEQALFAKHRLKVHNFMGATECGGIAYDRSDTPRDNAALIGSAMEKVSLNVENGLLQVRSPAVAETYWPHPGETLRGGVFRSSDLVELRDEKLFVLGRAADIIEIAGRKVAPDEIERALQKFGECLVFDVPRGHEKQIVAVVVGDPSRLDEIRKGAAELLPAWQVPRVWRFVETLGANARGKVSRAEWRRKFLSGGI